MPDDCMQLTAPRHRGETTTGWLGAALQRLRKALIGRRHGKERKPNIDSLTFDLTDCVLQERSVTHRLWMGAGHVAHLLEFLPTPLGWPFDLTDPGAAADYYGAQCADNKGAMLSTEVATLAGVEALRGVFKYRATAPRSLAMMYVAILWIPFDECSFQLNIESLEHGVTGIREAAVCVMEKDKFPLPAVPPVRSNDRREIVERIRATPVAKGLSDDSQYDRRFPDHPLSKVRARLSTVCATLRLDAITRAQRPYRVAR